MLLTVCDSFSQSSKGINVRRLSEEYRLTHYGVTSIHQDETGFIWIGTKEGLNRFDGQNNEIFLQKSSSSDELVDNNIRKICGDGKGHLFIRGNTSVSVFDLKTNHFKMIANEGIAAIFYGNESLWLASPNSIHRYNNHTQTIDPYFSFESIKMPSAYICAFCIDKQGDMHICTTNQGYFKISSKGTLLNSAKIGNVNAIVEDTNGVVWIATVSEGLYKVEKNETIKHYLVYTQRSEAKAKNNVREIVQKNDSLLYVGTLGGLLSFNINSGTFTGLDYSHGSDAFNSRSIVAMMKDKQGTLWLGTFYNGVMRYNPEYDFLNYYTNRMLSAPIVSSITEDRDGRIWMATEGGGLNLLNLQNNSVKHYIKESDAGTAANIIKSLYLDSLNNSLWAGWYSEGISRTNLNSPTINTANDILIKGVRNILKITPLNRDTLLFATNRGVAVVNKKSLEKSMLNVNYASSRRLQVWDILVDAPDTIWLTTSTGLYKYSLRGKTTKRYMFRDIVKKRVNNNMNFMLKDSKGRIWLGSTGSGLFLYDRLSDSFLPLGTKEGLAGDYITGIAQSPYSSDIIVATINGLSRIDINTLAIESYNATNGFPFGVITEGSLFISRSGRIYTGGLSGAISIDDRLLKVRKHNYALHISNIYVNNSLVQPSDSTGILSLSTVFQKSISLKPRFNTITFEVFSNDFLNSLHSKIEYKLVGFDNEFIESTDNRNITYTNLNPGKYTFIARGLLPDNEGNYPQTSIEVIILPPFYRTTLFILLSIFIILAVGAYFIRAYLIRVKLRADIDMARKEKEQLEEMNQSKFRFFTNVAHEFKTPVTLIKGHLERVIQRKEVVSPLVYSGILAAYRNSLHMGRLTDEIIDFNKQEQGYLKLRITNIDISNFIKEICKSFNQLAIDKSVGYDVEVSDDIKPVWVDTSQMEKVIYNLLSNAFEYAGVGANIKVKLFSDDNSAIIEVCDDGPGVAAEYIDSVFERFFQVDGQKRTNGSGIGLSFTKRIVEMHNGTISLRSTPFTETVFTVRLPFDRPQGDYIVEMDNEQLITTSSAIEFDDNNLKISGHRPKMVIVEDNHSVQELLVNILNFLYDITLACDGEKGIELIKSTQPEIVLSDVMMQGMNGMEMCARLKNDISTSHIPIVLLTACSSEEDMFKGLQTGADDYITKPFNIKLLIARCNNLVLSRKKMQQIYKNELESNPQMLTTNPADQKLLEQAEKLVMANIDNQNFGIVEFASAMNMSRSTLFAKIKGLTGMSPKELVISIRLKAAATKLITHSDISVAQIGYEFGFTSPSYFTKVFHELFGTTPKEYRKINLSASKESK